MGNCGEDCKCNDEAVETEGHSCKCEDTVEEMELSYDPEVEVGGYVQGELINVEPMGTTLQGLCAVIETCVGVRELSSDEESAKKWDMLMSKAYHTIDDILDTIEV